MNTNDEPRVGDSTRFGVNWRKPLMGLKAQMMFVALAVLAMAATLVAPSGSDAADEAADGEMVSMLGKPDHGSDGALLRV